jgi:hypothetical protein
MTLDELTTPRTSAQIKADIYAALAAQGLATTTWKPGAVVRTIIAAFAIVLAAFSQLQAAIARGGFLDLAEGRWLTLVAKHVYGVERDAGAFATGSVTLTNAGGGVYSLAPGDLILAHATSGKTYRNTATVNIVAGPSSVSVAVQADELGTASSAGGGTITVLKTPLPGITATNPAALVGRDEELDPALRQRCREKTATLSPFGPKDAYHYLAKSATRVATGELIGVTRVKLVPDGVGGITAYVATGSGNVLGTMLDTSTDLGAVHAQLDAYAAPLSITVTTTSATPKAIGVTYEAWVADTINKTNDEIHTAVETKLVAWMAAQPIGGYAISPAPGRVYVEAIEGVIAEAIGAAYLVKLQVTLPAADVDIASNEAPVVSAVTATAIHQLSGGVV